MLRANYFDDGYSQQGFIAAVPLLHGALRFTYRPALVEQRSQLAEAARRLSAPLYDRHAAAYTAGQIVVWDLTDAQGRPLSASSETLLRMQPDLFVKLHRIVVGWTPSDIDPAWPQEVAGRALDEQLEAALGGRTVGEVREEGDEKN